ncbi:Uncharacterized protein HZ326_31271 [Fusarium oxysporum f. sp. albedinis]|nr:Uncharacterized protein HZ326_31271 [Fusarium oxysporum f. sp. albedinis]
MQLQPGSLPPRPCFASGMLIRQSCRRKMGRILWFLAHYCGFANRRDIQRAPSQVRAQVRQKIPPGRWVHQIVLARAAQRENH